MVNVFHGRRHPLLPHYCAAQNAVAKFERADQRANQFVFSGTSFDPNVDVHAHEGKFVVRTRTPSRRVHHLGRRQAAADARRRWSARPMTLHFYSISGDGGGVSVGSATTPSAGFLRRRRSRCRRSCGLTSARWSGHSRRRGRQRRSGAPRKPGRLDRHHHRWGLAVAVCAGRISGASRPPR